MSHREIMRQEARLDKLVLNGAKGASSVITPTQIYSEIRAFNNRFSPAVFQASFNLLRLHEVPGAWRTSVVVVTLKRVSGLHPQSKPWMRHAIDTIEAVTPDEWACTSGEGQRFLISKSSSEREFFKRRDKVSVITYITRAPCTGLNINYLHITSTMGYEAESEKTLEMEDNWEQTFKDKVERMCSRTPLPSITFPSASSPGPAAAV